MMPEAVATPRWCGRGDSHDRHEWVLPAVMRHGTLQPSKLCECSGKPPSPGPEMRTEVRL